MNLYKQKLNALVGLALAQDEATAEEYRQQLRNFPAEPVYIPSSTLESVTRDVLEEIGCPTHLTGYEIAVTAIQMVVKDSTYLKGMMHRLYPEAALIHGITYKNVEHSLWNMISVLFDRADPDVLEQLFGSSLNPNSGKLSNKEFLAWCAGRVKHRMGDCQ